MVNINTPQELEAILGESIKSLRLQRNIDRQTLCDRSGVSMNALRHLENGQGATIKTLIRIIHALGKQDWLLSVAPSISINPLHMVRAKKPRQRAQRRTKKDGEA